MGEPLEEPLMTGSTVLLIVYKFLRKSQPLEVGFAKTVQACYCYNTESTQNQATLVRKFNFAMKDDWEWQEKKYEQCFTVDFPTTVTNLPVVHMENRVQLCLQQKKSRENS